MAALKPFVDTLENELTCSICQEIFTDPKTLPCLHSYCKICIVQWYERSGNQLTNRLNCPMCKARVEIPDGDASKLRSSFRLNSLLQLLNAMKTKTNQQGLPDCASCDKPVVVVAFCPQCNNGFICGDCVNAHHQIKSLGDEHHVTMLNEFKQENIDNFLKNQMMCKEKFHEKKKLEYYCQEETCKRCICQKCFALSHQNHRMQSLEEAADEAKQVIQQDMNRANQLKEKYEEELNQSKENKERIRKELNLVNKEVDERVEEICKMAREHGRAMKDAVDQILREQSTANDEEQTDINTGIEQIHEFQSHCQKLLERNGVAREIIESKEQFQQTCQILLETPLILCGKPIQRDMTVRYVTNHQVMQVFQDIGKIVKSVTDPGLSTIQSANEIYHGFVNEFNIITRNTEGEACHTRIESIDVKIKDVEGNEVEKKVFDEQNGKYRVNYKAKKDGPYEIQVNIGGEPIKNSPQNVNTLDVKWLFKPLKVFGQKGHDKGQFHRPHEIAVGDNGEIAIADEDNHRIQIFSLDGKYLREFGSKESGEGQLFEPFGVVFNEDRIIVSDKPDFKGRIQEFDLNGTYVRTIYGPEEGFDRRGMCVNDDKNIAVCSYGNKDLDIKPNIKLFSKEGDLIQEFYMADNDEQPSHIVYSNGKYFVSCFENNYVCVFDKNGVFLYKFGHHGKGGGQFYGLAGLAVYGPDMIFICDYFNHRVQLFTQEGQFIKSFGSYGSGLGQMSCPVDLDVTADGHVFVTEMTGNRVQFWK